jgi:CRP-like cAMP-binding protein
MSIETKYIYLKSHPLCNDLDESKLMQLCSVVKVHTVSKNDVIDYGDGAYSKIYLIVKGKVKIAESNDLGDELIKDILNEGDIFGDLSLTGHPDAEEYAEVLTANTVLLSMNVSDFRNAINTTPYMALNYAKKVSSKLRRLEDRHADLVFRDAKTRLIRFIKDWARKDGNRIGDKIVLNNYLTHSNIAGFIATSRQSVNVLLNELRDAGMLYYNRKKIELNDAMVWN